MKNAHDARGRTVRVPYRVTETMKYTKRFDLGGIVSPTRELEVDRMPDGVVDPEDEAPDVSTSEGLVLPVDAVLPEGGWHTKTLGPAAYGPNGEPAKRGRPKETISDRDEILRVFLEAIKLAAHVARATRPALEALGIEDDPERMERLAVETFYRLARTSRVNLRALANMLGPGHSKDTLSRRRKRIEEKDRLLDELAAARRALKVRWVVEFMNSIANRESS